MEKRVLLSWSSGKDSARALRVLQQSDDVRVVGLLTTFNRDADRVAMHAVRRQLVERQAEVIGLPLWDVLLPYPCSNAVYEERMREAIEDAEEKGITHFAFGDLYLEDIRAYRVRMLAGSGLSPLFPIWCSRGETSSLAREMIEDGQRAVVTCVDPAQCPESFAGRFFDRDFLDDLPEGVDPCGENGEFHTFCFDGPSFREPIAIRIGETISRDSFVFTDVLPVEGHGVSVA